MVLWAISVGCRASVCTNVLCRPKCSLFTTCFSLLILQIREWALEDEGGVCTRTLKGHTKAVRCSGRCCGSCTILFGRLCTAGCVRAVVYGRCCGSCATLYGRLCSGGCVRQVDTWHRAQLSPSGGASNQASRASLCAQVHGMPACRAAAVPVSMPLCGVTRTYGKVGGRGGAFNLNPIISALRRVWFRSQVRRRVPATALRSPACCWRATASSSTPR